MSLVWHHRLSNKILELGYDLEKETLVVTRNDNVRRFYGPVSYDMYTTISRAPFPERLIKQNIENKVPQKGHQIPVKWAP